MVPVSSVLQRCQSIKFFAVYFYRWGLRIEFYRPIRSLKLNKSGYGNILHPATWCTWPLVFFWFATLLDLLTTAAAAESDECDNLFHGWFCRQQLASNLRFQEVVRSTLYEVNFVSCWLVCWLGILFGICKTTMVSLEPFGWGRDISELWTLGSGTRFKAALQGYKRN